MNNKTTRLNKFIAQSGLCSRRDADELILQGKVKVNNNIVQELGFQIGKNDIVKVDDKQIEAKQIEYYVFHKPAGYITTSDDEKNRKTIYEFFPDNLKHLKPVGRLDKDSSGLLLMTNDGDLINKMTHPSVKIPKMYRVVVKGKMQQFDMDKMTEGIEIEQGKTAWADVRLLEYEDNKNTVLEVRLYQGLNRQIRKMTDYLGFPVISLKRISHGCLNLIGLKRGQYKKLRTSQVKELLTYIKKVEQDLV